MLISAYIFFRRRLLRRAIDSLDQLLFRLRSSRAFIWLIIEASMPPYLDRHLMGWTVPHPAVKLIAPTKEVVIANVAVLGIDIAKNVFQLHGVDADGQVVLRRRVIRDQLLQMTEAIPPCLIQIEAARVPFTGSGILGPKGIL